MFVIVVSVGLSSRFELINENIMEHKGQVTCCCFFFFRACAMTSYCHYILLVYAYCG